MKNAIKTVDMYDREVKLKLLRKGDELQVQLKKIGKQKADTASYLFFIDGVKGDLVKKHGLTGASVSGYAPVTIHLQADEDERAVESFAVEAFELLESYFE